MNLKVAKSDIEIIKMACTIAINSEMELIDCYHVDFDEYAVKHAYKNITQIKKLRLKIIKQAEGK